MECWHCERPANAVCSFCGRSVCKEHAKILPIVLTMYRDKQDKLKGLAVSDSVYCGVCHPKDEPVDLDDIG